MKYLIKVNGLNEYILINKNKMKNLYICKLLLFIKKSIIWFFNFRIFVRGFKFGFLLSVLKRLVR